MRYSRFFFALFTFVLTFSTTSSAQLFEDFESGDKASYSGAPVDLSTGTWFLDDALIGNLSNDKFNGNWSVRMDRRDGKTGNIYMQFDKPNGADEVSFYLAHYGNNAEDAALQVQYSIDGGSNWTNIGDEIPAPFDLTEYTIPVQVDGNIRFKFVQSGGTDRMNIDDIRITDFIAPTDSATVLVTQDDAEITVNSTIDFGSVLEGGSASKTLEIKNVGSNKLWISEIITEGSDFSASYSFTDSLAFNDSIDLMLTFEPETPGVNNGSVTISSNSVSDSVFTINLTGEGLSSSGTIPIADARVLPEGTEISIAGIVTVAEEFAGPMYFQDETGGIAWYFNDMRDNTNTFFADVSRGDSIIITGELGSFNDLIQIVGENPQFQFRQNQIEINPVQITIDQMNSGAYEGQLVAIDVEITGSGALQGNTNYEITDNTGIGEMRISSFTNIVGSTAPSGTSTIVGVIGIFSGTYQLLPRDLNDIDAEINVIPGEDVSKDETFEVVTWNIEYFGNAGNGPEDDDIQFRNAVTVIDSIDADIYALQEISDQGYFNALIDTLDEYEGVLATFSQDQKTAYLYKTETVELLNSGLITSGMQTSDWANGRFPLLLHVNATINEETQEFYFYNIHAKAFAEETDYDQRINASAQLKNYLDGTHQGQNVIVLGDLNDEILQSTYQGIESPYKNFDDDEEYTIITKSLEEQGFTSYTSISMLDHIIMNSSLEDEYFEGTERIENTSYISSYLSQTSDHFPVWVRFEWGTPVSNEFENAPQTFTLQQNYPNPFNPSTQINYTLASSSTVTLDVFDVMGRRVATLVQKQNQAAGDYSYTFNASNMASGVYIYQLNTGSQVLTKKMTLIK